jgi:hypothetical protein
MLVATLIFVIVSLATFGKRKNTFVERQYLEINRYDTKLEARRILHENIGNCVTFQFVYTAMWCASLAVFWLVRTILC